MRRLFAPVILVLSLAALVAASGCSVFASGGPVATNAVSIETSSFSPPAITVKVGDTVTWTNKDKRTHNVTLTGFDGGAAMAGAATGDGFDSGEIQVGDTFSQTFDKAGSYDYYDRYEPSLTGKITVK